MRKIVSLFQRNYDGDRLVRDELVKEAEWVQNGEGTATRKYDGTCCLIREGKLFKRYEVKRGKTPPPNFEPANEVDPNTGKQQGWVPVGEGTEDQWHREAFERLECRDDGTYELMGPKVQGNLEGYREHVLLAHADAATIEDCPRTFNELRDYLADGAIEGVWPAPQNLIHGL
jgi:hypothetical protein